MALDPTRLSTTIFGTLTADPRSGFSNPLSPAQQAMVRAWTDAIAAAVIAELKANAVVSVQSVGGVTPGAGVSGPGTGTVS
jgi:hypothetical protein